MFVFPVHLRSFPAATCFEKSVGHRDPALSVIQDRQPMAERRLTSSCFLGVPSGLLGSHSIDPSKPTAAATRCANSRMPGQCQCPRSGRPRFRLHRLEAHSHLTQTSFLMQTQAIPRSSACEILKGSARTPAGHRGRPTFFCLVEPANQGH